MPKKPSPFEFTKYIPIAVMAVSLISGYTLLKANVSRADEKIESLEAKVAEVDKEQTQMLVGQAEQKIILAQVYELVKDIKDKK